MQALILLIVSLCALDPLPAQQPLSPDDALGQLYLKYDAQQKTAQWACTRVQDKSARAVQWPCSEEYSTVSVSVLLIAEVQEGDAAKVYVAASATPANTPAGFECHSCAPAIGAAVFAWQAQHWVVQSANAAIGLYGDWGRPPRLDLVQVGPEKHGLLLSIDDVGQGFAFSSKVLLVPLEKTISQAWSIEDELDDLGAIDPDDKLNKPAPYRASAAFRFYAVNSDDDGSADYYDIEVISRGESSKDTTHLTPENWTEIYVFKDGKYRLLSHRDFTEVRKSARKPPP